MSGLCSSSAARNVVGVGVDPEIEDLEAGALEHHRDEVLADVVDVALHGADHDLADRLDAGLGEQRAQDRHAGLHRVGGEEHLGHEEDAVAEVDADDAHALDERLVQDVVGGPTAAEQEVRALRDLVGEAVVEIVVHLGDERVVGEAGEIDSPPSIPGRRQAQGNGNPRCGKDPRIGKSTDSGETGSQLGSDTSTVPCAAHTSRPSFSTSMRTTAVRLVSEMIRARASRDTGRDRREIVDLELRRGCPRTAGDDRVQHGAQHMVAAARRERRRAGCRRA